MPSFVRRAKPSDPTGLKDGTEKNVVPRGAYPCLTASDPPLYLISGGIPSLDDVLGGGIPLGGTFLLLCPDQHTSYGKVVERYFLSRGFVDGHKCLIVGEAGRELVKGCMWTEGDIFPGSTLSTLEGEGSRSQGRFRRGSESEGEETGMGDGQGGDGKTKIAWRYEGMKKFETSVKGEGSKGHRELTLLKTIPAEVLARLETEGKLSYISLDLEPVSSSNKAGPSRPPTSGSESESFRIMSKALARLNQVIKDHQDSQVLRVVIHDLGSMDWGSPSSEEMHQFLFSLRRLVRDRSVTVLLTLPPHLAHAPPSSVSHSPDSAIRGPGKDRWVKDLAWSVDSCFELKGFGDDPTLAPHFHPLHGLLIPHSLPTTHQLLPSAYKHSSLLGLSTFSSTDGRGGGAGENNLGFRMTRKRMVIETVHLGIEGGQGERRTEPAEDLSGIGMAKAMAADRAGMGVDKAGEGVEKSVPIPQTGKKPRARVRFGGEEEVMLAPEAGPEELSERAASVGRPIVRHDKMELYDF